LTLATLDLRNVYEAMMGASQRRKGAVFEREMARRIARCGNCCARRNITETQTGLASDIDAPDLPVTWQLKVGAKPNVWAAVREADEASNGTGNYAIAVVRKNKAKGRPKQDIAVLPLRDLESLIQELRGTGIW